MITFKLASDGIDVVMTLRTSGTEPKVRAMLRRQKTSNRGSLQIKYYIEGRGNDRDEVARSLDGVVRELRDSWMRAKENGLEEP